jgi:hypothetical protein
MKPGAKYAANVVRAKAATSAQIEFGLESRAKDQAAFRLEEGLGVDPLKPAVKLWSPAAAAMAQN